MTGVAPFIIAQWEQLTGFLNAGKKSRTLAGVPGKEAGLPWRTGC
jgi:hypothetical protein